MTDYADFLRQKIKLASFKGFDVAPEAINPTLKPHTRDIVRWALQGGQRAIFASFGLHKTATQLEILRQIGLRRPEMFRLQVAPYGLDLEFMEEIAQRFTGACGIDLRVITRESEIDDPATLYWTHYEPVRDGHINPARFGATSLDEADVLRSYGSKTFQEFLPAFEPVEFKFVATATPSPNRYKELIHYAGYLGVMDTGQALTRFFQRDSTQANNLTLYPHKETEFWLWVASWAAFVQRPSDLCGCTCHKELTSPGSDSATSSCVNGCQAPSETAHGNASATAAAHTSHVVITSQAGGSSAADASDPSTVAKGQQPTTLGAPCATDAADPDAKTGRTTAAEASPCVNGGASSLPSSTTWDNHQKVEPSSVSTTTATTNQATANGRPALSKPATEGYARLRGYCDGCRCDEGYVLPELDVRYHEVPSNYEAAGADKSGQGLLIPDVALGLSAAAAEKRQSLEARVAVVQQLVAEAPEDHFIVWHDLEDEREALQAAIPDAVSVYGNQDRDERRDFIRGFSRGQHRVLSTKPIICGAGCNFQRHCHREVFAGIGFKFKDFIQAIHRVHRFGQAQRVRIDIVHTEAEREVLATLKTKWAQHDATQARMSELIRKFGLNQLAMQDTLARTIGVERVEVKSNLFQVANNDAVEEAKLLPDNSLDMVLTSIPFANHYEYTPSYNDFGHTQDNDHFWRQMDFLTPELVRALKPGRIAAIHVKDRVLFQSVTGLGAPTVDFFHEEAAFHLRKHGLVKLAVITITTDVVRENNQTYRLSYSEMLKDGTKMGAGCSEYLLVFRKLQTDLSRGYADEPVEHSAEDYSLARWQIDAHDYWRSSGNRLLTAEEMAAMGPQRLASFFTQDSLRRIYDFGHHVAVGEGLEARKALPKKFMCLAPGSPDPTVWTDVLRMDTLNGEQASRNVEKHVCPLQFDIVDRAIERYSNPGDLIYDPFHGLGTVGVRAIKLGRKAGGSELNPGYFADQVRYLRAAEAEALMPSLFDALDLPEVRKPSIVHDSPDCAGYVSPLPQEETPT